MFNPDLMPPSLEMEGLVTLVMSLLGLGAMRSFEKSKGIARENMKK
jgi:Tfp pilus assembly protein PilX